MGMIVDRLNLVDLGGEIRVNARLRSAAAYGH
jgi:hypothetical protein